MRRAIVRLVGNRDLVKVITVSAVFAAVMLDAAMAYAARPGGGGSFSGGSRSSGGGGSRSSGGGGGGGGSGGSGGGEAIGALIYLCFEHPVIGIPILLIVIVVVILRARATKESSGNDWSSGGGFDSFVVGGNNNYGGGYYQPPPPPRPMGEPLKAKLESLRGTDPGFSIVVFEDFLYFLYAEMHRARGAGGAQALSAYVSDAALGMLANDGRVAGVEGIIIGSMTYESVSIDPQGGARVDVIVEANYVEKYRPSPGGGEQRFYVKERLSLVRAAGAKSRDAGKSRTLNCPNCGGPLSNMRGTTCTYCKTTVPQGTKDWAITGIQVLEKEPRGPLLTSSVEEAGTELPTITSPTAQTVFGQICGKDPQGTSWAQVQQRTTAIFQEFHAGWVGRDPSRVRPYVSDNLFQSQLYWIDLYKANRCINRTDGSHITRLELAAASTDAYYDSVTLRLFATGQDYTVGEDGRVMSGIQGRMRPYSEYWTLIRGAQKKKTDKPGNACPNCGAPMKISMTGNCEYCKVKVTSGEYDWVLSRIEQDEVYTG